MKIETRTTDVVIVGAGGAGLRAALEVARAGLRAAVISKGPLVRSGVTTMAHHQIQACIDTSGGDTPETHFADTVRGGFWLSEQPLAMAMAEEMPARIQDLVDWGVSLDRADGRLLQIRAPGQSYPRSVILKGGARAMMATLVKAGRQTGQLEFLESAMVTRILLRDQQVAGVLVLEVAGGRLALYRTSAVILASGGYQQLWQFNDNPAEITGDAMALAARAGAELVDLEQSLFHPVVACYPERTRGIVIPQEVCLQSEMADGKLVNGQGETIYGGGKLMWSQIAQLIHREVQAGRGGPHGGVFLDLTRSSKSPEEVRGWLLKIIPGTYRYIKDLGIDLVHEPIEVAPAAHNTLGGIRIDDQGNTRVPGLFAAGEAAGNVHGANRLGGNGLSDGQAFGFRAGRAAARWAGANPGAAPDHGEVAAAADAVHRFRAEGAGIHPRTWKARLQAIMQQHCGAARHAPGLIQALEEMALLTADLAHLRAPAGGGFAYRWQECLECEGMATLADLVLRSALAREESRGYHCREDFPQQDNARRPQHTVASLRGEEPAVGTVPVDTRLLPPPA